MSRIGKMPVTIPEKIEVTVSGQNVSVKGPVGTIDYTFTDRVKIQKNETEVIVEPVTEDDKALWGTTRAVIQNMITGAGE